ncbi:MAG: hypothetical protein R3301_09080, partial [Saprospiraceae bacterium]|nr:hypothetical protein [Saprospiraceae bacterium]
MTRTWTQVEVELIVEDYFSMLVKELSGIPYRKSYHRKRLKPLLNGRSEGSIEYKHQNISAVLVQYGQLYLKGYLPRFNYQRLLEQAVLDHLSSQSSIKGVFSNFVEGEIDSIPNVDFDQILVDPPSKRVIAEPEGSYSQRRLSINYLEREQRNQRLGKLGEELVVK